MLILSRKIGEKIVIDGSTTITVNAISNGGRVSLGIESNLGVVRGELRPEASKSTKEKKGPTTR